MKGLRATPIDNLPFIFLTKDTKITIEMRRTLFHQSRLITPAMYDKVNLNFYVIRIDNTSNESNQLKIES